MVVMVRVAPPVVASLELDTGQVVEGGKPGRRVVEDQERLGAAGGGRGHRGAVEEGHRLQEVAAHEGNVDQEPQALDLASNWASYVMTVVQDWKTNTQKGLQHFLDYFTGVA